MKSLPAAKTSSALQVLFAFLKLGLTSFGGPIAHLGYFRHQFVDRRRWLDDAEFAFPKERKEPLTDAAHVRNAIARFDQVEGVSDTERDQAWKRILAAAKRHGVEVSAARWQDLAKGGKDRKG